MILGITGGIGAGKSTVSEYLQKKGIPVIDADATSHAITQKGQKGCDAVKNAFGEDFFVDGELDRKKLALYCFGNKERTEKLNAVLHPIILSEMEKRAAEYNGLIVYDVPLLFESGMDKKCDKILTVVCDREKRIMRAAERSNMTREEIIKRIDRQMTDEERKAKSDYIVDNSGSLEKTYAQTDKILKELGNGR